MFLMVSMMVVIITSVSIEGESTNQCFSISPGCCWVPQLASTKNALSSNKEDKENLMKKKVNLY